MLSFSSTMNCSVFSFLLVWTHDFDTANINLWMQHRMIRNTSSNNFREFRQLCHLRIDFNWSKLSHFDWYQIHGVQLPSTEIFGKTMWWLYKHYHKWISAATCIRCSWGWATIWMVAFETVERTDTRDTTKMNPQQSVL